MLLVEDSNLMLDDSPQLLQTQSRADVVVCGDFNANVREGMFFQQMSQMRWCPLAYHTE